MLGGDLRGKENSDTIYMCAHPVLRRCLLFPFHRNKGKHVAHCGQRSRLHCKRGGRKAQMEKSLYPLPEAEKPRQDNRLYLNPEFRKFPQKQVARREVCCLLLWKI